jgi:hypothetical protein
MRDALGRPSAGPGDGIGIMTLDEVNALPEFDVDRLTEVGAHFVDEETPQFWIDREGRGWTLGRYRCGEWFKRRVD